MSAATADPPAPPTPSAGADRTSGARRFLPRRSTVLVVLVVLLTVVLVALTARDATRTDPLDPRNPSPSGAQALARVLDDEGVEVDVVRDLEAFERTEVDGGTTVLVTSPYGLGGSVTDRLLEHAADGQLVVAGAGAGAVGIVDDADTPTFVDGPEDVPADCTGDASGGADLTDLEITVDTAEAYPFDGCFAVDEGSLLVSPRPGVSVLGADGVLSNEQILRADNAAVALRLLGARERLVWFVPDPADLSAGDSAAPSSLLPPWLGPSLWLLLLTSFVAIYWRARRFGPLVTEPLPVHVKASETTRSRGRLYHRGRDRGHAAGALRRATRERLATRLGIPAAPAAPGAPDPVVLDVARRTARHPAEVAWLLDPTAPPPESDTELVDLADALAALDREVRRT
ncbi:DUF4350 domain-containing protein [Nocardioides sp. CFH 31398]|uniref:DUF4350 domain-containing protein n=1 Tax=Nocardioides sp. CFH 31398 TaxID=2919579 RepID=UPI001F06145A|nr:DUF4350 domain-containing protein [Nocardioides sp. CFH 31398]MCH1868925.1 DUF4350 domain-containing protein [Nocardioides sp. CFH 31398]